MTAKAGACPWCGCPHLIERSVARRDLGSTGSGETFQVECPSCGALGPKERTSRESLAIWNRLDRPPRQAVVGVEEIRALMREYVAWIELFGGRPLGFWRQMEKLLARAEGK